MKPIRCRYNAASAAGIFVQMSLRARYSAATPPILDLLLPARGLRVAPTPARVARVRAFSTKKLPWQVREDHRLRRRPVSHVPRQLSTTASRGATLTAFNPQRDEDGNEMRLEITPRAAKRLSEIMTKDANPNLALRIQVESGGCHGFQYLMSLVTLPPTLPEEGSLCGDEKEGEIREDDTIFAFTSGDDLEVGNLSAPKIILDNPSLELLKGSKVDFTMELIGSQFKIIDNPLATSSCGCGTSFDIKI